jgi:hypothetical protein
MGARQNLEDINIGRAATEALGFEVPRGVGVERWNSRRLVADHHRDGNVFLASDATHLASVLSAEVHGWAGHRFLDAYEIEGRPIGEMVSNVAVRIMKIAVPRCRFRDGLDDATPQTKRHDALWASGSSPLTRRSSARLLV